MGCAHSRIANGRFHRLHPGRSLLMVAPAGGTAFLLEPRLVQVPPSAGQPVTRGLLQSPERRPVRVVVLLDDLERPPALEYVAADQLFLDRRRELVVPGRAQRLHRISEFEVGLSAELVEAVEVTLGALDALQRRGELASATTVPSSTSPGSSEPVNPTSPHLGTGIRR